jgi:hypothetical protein
VMFWIGSHIFAQTGPDPKHAGGLDVAVTSTQLVSQDGVLLTFCPGWTQTQILPISKSWVGGITGWSHHAQPSLFSIHMNLTSLGTFMQVESNKSYLLETGLCHLAPCLQGYSCCMCQNFLPFYFLFCFFAVLGVWIKDLHLEPLYQPFWL